MKGKSNIKTEMVMTVSFCFFILQMPSHTIFLCMCCTNTIAFKNPKAAFIEFELLKVQSKRGDIELFLTQVS